jgi:shikimate kinase
MEGIVLATGGGAVLNADSRRRLSARGIVIYLNARPEDLYERVRHDRNRPLLATADPQSRLEELYAVRDPLYREAADIVMDTGKQSVQALAKELLARLDPACKLSA